VAVEVIRVEFDVDNQPLQASKQLIKDVAKELDVTEEKVEDVNNEFKEQASLLEKLRAKEKALLALREKSFNIDELRAYRREIVDVRKQINQLTSEQNKFDKKIQESTPNVTTFIKGFLGAQAITSTFRKVTDVIKKAVGAAADFEQTEVVIEQFVGSAQKAEELLSKIQALDSPFGFEKLAESAENLLSLNVEAAKIPGILEKLGDISVGTGTSLSQLSDIYGQMSERGRVFNKDLNRLTKIGIPIIDELAKQFGVTNQEIAKLVRDGKVGFNSIEQALTDMTGEGGKFFGLTEKLADTTAGKISVLKNRLESISIEFGKALLPVINRVITGFSKLVQKVGLLVKPSISQELRRQQIELNALAGRTIQAAEGTEQRLTMVRQLQKEMPDFLGNLDAEKVSNEDIAIALKEVNKQFERKIDQLP